MQHNYSISYKRILLRPLEERDIEELRVLRNKNKQYFNTQDDITPEQQKAWFQKYLAREDDCMFALELISNPGVFVGAVAFYDIDKENGIAEGGRTIVDKEKAPERGIGKEMAFAHAALGFMRMGLKRVICYVHKDNERAIKMNEKSGNKIIGERGNDWCMAVDAEDFVLPDPEQAIFHD